MNGLEFLKKLRADPRHEDLVVFVLSTSSVEREIEEATKYGIAGYVVKTKDGQDLNYLISRISVYHKQAQNLLSH
ncbi:MAG: DNA-binding NarL/FixJ family response regulator [Verrucomicrobiales bacterium]|jgi:DNA-binding NarL/FixJ family response regulator